MSDVRRFLVTMVSAFLMLACSIPSSPERQAREAALRAIVISSMDFAARSGTRTSRHCVLREVGKITFERWHDHQKTGGEPTLGLANPAEYKWAWLNSEDATLGGEMAKALTAAIAQHEGRNLRELPADWIDRRMTVVSEPVFKDDCPIHIFSDPVVEADWAFIEDDIMCGRWCGAGKTMALRRDGERWAVVAVAPTWHVGFDRMMREPPPPADSNQFVDL